MKTIKYHLVQRTNVGTPEEPVWKESEGLEKTIRCVTEYLEANLVVARAEAYNGEVAVEDDNQSDLVNTPTQLDVIEAQVTYTALMTDTLLEV